MYDFRLTESDEIQALESNRLHLFSDAVIGQGLCSCRLSHIGNIIENEITQLTIRYSQIKIDKYIVMPNHIHMILIVGEGRQERNPCPTRMEKQYWLLYIKW